MSLKIKKQPSTPATLKLQIEEEGGELKTHSWLIQRAKNSDMLRFAGEGEQAGVGFIARLISTAEPLEGAPSLLELVDMLDKQALDELYAAVVTASTSDIVDIANGPTTA